MSFLVDIDYHGGLTCSLGYDDLYYDTDRSNAVRRA